MKTPRWMWGSQKVRRVRTVARVRKATRQRRRVRRERSAASPSFTSVRESCKMDAFLAEINLAQHATILDKLGYDDPNDSARHLGCDVCTWGSVGGGDAPGGAHLGL